ncbi:MAG: hypothetical protein AAB250_17720 [Bdellovibrionota bacterium]
MKGAPVPSRADLRKTYETLQFSKGPRSVSVRLIVKWSEWARLDVRLAEVLAIFIGNEFKRINPFELWQANRNSALPQALALILEFSKAGLRARGDRDLLIEFSAWAATVVESLKRGPPQMFFVREGPLKPSRDLSEIEFSLKVYRKWGFFGTDSVISQKRASGRSRSVTLLEKSQRERVLSRLLSAGSKISVADYMAACGNQIHRRTAERDLAKASFARASGYTRNRRYSRV